MATGRAAASNRIARVEVVPWSMARIWSARIAALPTGFACLVERGSARPLRAFGLLLASATDLRGRNAVTADDSIQLPRDQYAHSVAANEWWWHIGTLKAGDRVFGFEINAAKRSISGMNVTFSELMVTDVQGQVHCQATSLFPFDPNWAEADPAQPWRVVLGAPGGDGAVSMTAPAADVETLQVDASFTDAAAGTALALSLRLQQQGAPLLVWGTGVS